MITSRKTRRRRFAAATMSTLGLSLAAFGANMTPAAAATHLVQSFTFPDNLCGFDGISQVSIIDNFGPLPAGATFDAGSITQTFTADNGRGVRLTFDAGHEYNAAPVFNADGTVTRVFTYSGANVKTQALDGPVLEQGAGLVQVTVTFDWQGNVVSVSVQSLAGNNPNLTGAPDCAVIAPYLAS